MYQMCYADIVEESGISARERESVLFNRCINLLENVRKYGVGSCEAREAARFIEDFWIALIEDLSRPENALPEELRASLISIGLYVVKECTKMAEGTQVDINALIDISSAIRDGLSNS